MYCDLWSCVLWSLDFQNKKRIVFAKIIWGDTVGCVDFLCVSKPAHGELPEKSRKLKGALTLYIDHSRSKQRTDQMVLELTLKFLGKKSSSSNSIFQTGELEKSSAETEGVRNRVMRGMLMQTDQRARTKVLLFMKPFYLNCQLSCEPGISIVCCFLTGPFQTHNCFKRKLTSAWFFFQLLSQI